VQEEHADSALLAVAAFFLPAAQFWHVCCPSVFWYLPVPQSAQVACPFWFVALPVAQAVHELAAWEGEAEPGAHCWHWVDEMDALAFRYQPAPQSVHPCCPGKF
jgi:hypothetical protein